MEENKEIYLAKTCKIFDEFGVKKLDLYDEEIIVIQENPNKFKEIITGIEFKRYPKSIFNLNKDRIYIMLDKRVDNTKEGYDLIRRYYEEVNEDNIFHMISWFNMGPVDRYNDYMRRFEANNLDYNSINNKLVRAKMKDN